MDGGRGAARSVARGAMAAGVIAAVTGFTALTAGPAMANDRSTVVACVDRSTGEWRATMTFSSIDVKDGHPVVVRFGSATVTLADPGPDGSATLRQDASGDQAAATWAWSVTRNGVVERSGSSSFRRPGGCEATQTTGPTEPPATEPPATEPPATEPPATEPPATEPPATVPPVGPSPPGPSRPEIPMVIPTAPPTTDRAGRLPVTGAPAGATGAAAVVVVGLGVLVLRWTKRRSDQLIGD